MPSRGKKLRDLDLAFFRKSEDKEGKYVHVCAHTHTRTHSFLLTQPVQSHMAQLRGVCCSSVSVLILLILF